MKGREKKSIIKKWWFWLIVVIAIGCVYTASQPKNQANETTKSASDAKSSEQPTQADNKQEKKKDRLTLDDGWQVDKSDPYITKVTGVVSNNSDKAINGYIQIIFSALDAGGANVGDCLANANTVDANGKWKFEAMCSGNGIETVRFKSLTGF